MFSKFHYGSSEPPYCPRMEIVKGTFHSTIFDIPMRPVREDQSHRRRFTR